MKHIKLFESFLNEETIKGPRGLSVNLQHDYLTLKTPVGNFTTGRSGAKASGQLTSIPGAFKAIDDYVENAVKNKKSYGEAFKDLLDPKLMDVLVPGWDKPKVVNVADGDRVVFSDEYFKKQYPGEYNVKYVKGKYAYLELPDKKSGEIRPVGVQLHTIEKIESKK